MQIRKFLLVFVLSVALLGAALTGARPVRAVALTSLSPTLGGCPVLPVNNIWNRPVTDLPVAANSAAYVQSIGPNTGLHADFGQGLYEGAPMGIPYNLVTSGQTKSTVTFTWDDESDAGPYPIPSSPLIEGGAITTGDRHLLMLDTSACVLYELYHVKLPANGSGWKADAGAIFDLRSNALRPDTWTSADAAGLPILPGLARYDEVAAGHINHALRFTVDITQKSYVWPARHQASDQTSSAYPPMGMRFRLKASFNTSGYSPQAKVILEALKTYGMIVADNGSNWYISGTPDDGWDNDDLHHLSQVLGTNFEAVDTSSLMVLPDSGMVSTFPGMRSLWVPMVKK
jgi:hypothetical protein